MKGRLGRAEPSDTATLAGLVRERDRPRYFATLFAPSGLRRELFALYGFAAEIERVPHLVSDAGLGEIRLRWWLDAVEGLETGEASAHPALRELQFAVERRALPLEPIVSLIEARRADLYADPPESVADLEGYYGETESALFQLACLVAGGRGVETADAAGHAGVAYGLTRSLANFARDRAARGRAIVPREILRAEGLSAADMFDDAPPEALVRGRARMIELAEGHLLAARQRIAVLPATLRVVFLPLATTQPLLFRLSLANVDTPSDAVELPDLQSLARIGLARLGGNRI